MLANILLIYTITLLYSPYLYFGRDARDERLFVWRELLTHTISITIKVAMERERPVRSLQPCG